MSVHLVRLIVKNVKLGYVKIALTDITLITKKSAKNVHLKAPKPVR
jgi:hypothetical protein